MKLSPDITMETDIGQEQRQLGVIGILDGCSVIKVPANRVPEDFGFMIAHPSATVAPAKLEEYKIHIDPIGLSGSLVEGRMCYDAFVLENKKNGIYYQAVRQQPSNHKENRAECSARFSFIFRQKLRLLMFLICNTILECS